MNKNQHIRHVQSPTIFVVFGATGDLMQKKLIPSLFDLFENEFFPEHMKIVATARRSFDDEAYRSFVRETLKKSRGDRSPEAFDEFLKYFSYVAGNFHDKESYLNLNKALKNIDDEWGLCSNKLFYLAVPPVLYRDIFSYLAETNLTEPCSDKTGWTRVLVEKPFGRNLKTAHELDEMLGRLFKEEQIFRIDHYLTKEATQQMLALRFSNSIFESAWDNSAIEKVEIRLLEKFGVGERGSFYDEVGALRDVGQNHLLQMFALVAMDRPETFDAKGIRQKRAQAIESLHVMGGEEVAKNTTRAQYEGYKDIEGVADDSQTETYFKLQATVDSDRWRGVPFYLESGKSLHRSSAEVIVTFAHAEPCLCPENSHFQNILSFQLQPEQRIDISFFAKKPGVLMEVEEKEIVFDYGKAFSEDSFDAYEKLLLDCMAGNQTLFVGTDEVLAGWKFVDAILDVWHDGAVPLRAYKPGEPGPESEKY